MKILRFMAAGWRLIPACVAGCMLAAGAAGAQTQARIDLTTLDGGQICRPGEFVDIVWRMTGQVEGNLGISLWDGIHCRWVTIASGVPASAGHFSWRVPGDLAGDRFRLRVENPSAKIYGMSRTFFTIKAPTGVADIQDEKKTPASTVTTWPNPVARDLHVAWSGHRATTCLLRDAAGNVVVDRAVDGLDAATLSIVDLPAGIYFVELLFDDGSRSVEKVVRGK